MTHKYAPKCAYILFHKMFLTFKKNYDSAIYICFLFFARFFIVICSLGNFLHGDLKN
jgi:hypothetical protein